MAKIIDTGRANTVVVEAQRTVAAVREVSRPVKVSSPGPRGPAGPAGASGEGQLPVVEFAYGDASSVVLVLPAGLALEVLLVSLEIEVPFDGAGAQLQVGVMGQPGLLMQAEQNDPTQIATFEVSPRVELPGATGVLLTIAPGTGATQGSGRLTVQTAPTT